MKRGIKHHQMPGDIPKRDKIMLLEKKRNAPNDLRDARKGVKTWKKVILMKERAVLKKRFQKMLEE
jgi:hypothetical protein